MTEREINHKIRIPNNRSSKLITTTIGVITLMLSSMAYSQDIQPTKEQLLKIPPETLATGIRVVSDAQLPFIDLVRKGMKTYKFNELNTVATIDHTNVDLWETTFKARLDLYISVATDRGAKDITGNYTVKFDHPSCGKNQQEPDIVEITQEGNSFSFILQDKINGIGTIVENSIVLNMGNTIGKVPYWNGEVNNDQITLQDSASKCYITLTKN